MPLICKPISPEPHHHYLVCVTQEAILLYLNHPRVRCQATRDHPKGLEPSVSKTCDYNTLHLPELFLCSLLQSHLTDHLIREHKTTIKEESSGILRSLELGLNMDRWGN